MAEKIFVVSRDNAESIEIINLLTANDYEVGKNLLITDQESYVPWENLEPEIKDIIRTETQRNEIVDTKNAFYGPQGHKVIVQGELPEDYTGPVVPYPPDFSNIYGVKLLDNTLCHTISTIHGHESSIEQVAEIIGVELSLEQQFIAANARDGVSGMEELAKLYMMPDAQAREMIQKVKKLVRAANGITEEQELQAEEAIKNMITQENGLNIIHLPHNEYDTITDRISSSENILIICDNGEARLYGWTYIYDDLESILRGTSMKMSPSPFDFASMEEDEDEYLYFTERYDSQMIINSLNSIIKERNTLGLEIDMSIYEHQEYDIMQLGEIKEGLKAGVDVSQYTILNSEGKPVYKSDQMREIRFGLMAGVDVSLFANPKFDEYQMQEIREGLEMGIDVSQYAKPELSTYDMVKIQSELITRADKIRTYAELGFNAEQTQELLEGLKSGVDVDVYAKPEYDWYKMHIIRERLEEGFPADYALFVSDKEKQFTPEIKNILRSYNFNNDQIYEYRQGIEAGLNVNLFKDLNSDNTPFYSADEMHQIRLSLEAGVDINQYIIPGTRMFDYDKLQEAREKIYEEQKANKKEEISDEELETYISDEESKKYDSVPIPEAISNSEKSSGEMLSNDESNYDCL